MPSETSQKGLYRIWAVNGKAARPQKLPGLLQVLCFASSQKGLVLVHDIGQMLIQDPIHVLNWNEVQLDLALLGIDFLAKPMTIP